MYMRNELHHLSLHHTEKIARQIIFQHFQVAAEDDLKGNDKNEEREKNLHEQRLLYVLIFHD